MKKKEDVFKEYIDLIIRTEQQLDSLIYELETEALHNEELRAYSLEMAMDSVPIVRHLKEAKKHLDISKSLYQ